MLYAEIILPLPLKSTFTYAVPDAMASSVRIGSRVIVPFGRKKYYTGIVALITSVAPQGYDVKEIAMTVAEEPAVTPVQLKLWQWVADYYMAPLGDVYKAAVPAGMKLESETYVEINPDYEEDGASPLTEREAIICQFLDHEAKRLRISDIEKRTELRRINRDIARLLERGAVIISERLVERYRPRKVIYVRAMARDSESRQAAFAAVKGAPKQERALLALTELSRSGEEITRQALMERADVSAAIIMAMEKKGVLEQYKKEVSRFAFDGNVDGTLPKLTSAQSVAFGEIDTSWADHGVTLLHGVTSSGKTEIYIHLIDQAMKLGRQALLMVPEIALTTQLTKRLQRVFGDKVVIYHSKFSDNERVELWQRLLHSAGEPLVVIGARSSVFLPYQNLGLVIVDEEHDSSYKQSDPAPRYSGRDTAVMLARMHGAKTLLGSATPAIETYYKALSGKYGLATLGERYDNALMPEVKVTDMTALRRKSSSLSIAPETRMALSQALKSGKQAIVFINRRGYAPMARCRTCGYTARCERCDVTLTYHRAGDCMVCHYCGASYPVPRSCPACEEPGLEITGYGTERIEEELAMSFPDASIARMDLDTTRAKDSYGKIIDDFSEGRSNLLVGTQMVTKGLDFNGVTTVAVVNADAVLHYPDYRSTERAFTMLEQVAGRAGRRSDKGTVMVQSYEPGHPVYGFVKEHDYRGFYDYEIESRKEYCYPPFTRLICIYMKNADRDSLISVATAYGAQLRSLLGDRVLGPDEPPVARIQSLYIRRIMIKVEPEASVARVKAILRDLESRLYQHPGMSSTQIHYDVDPQ